MKNLALVVALAALLFFGCAAPTLSYRYGILIRGDGLVGSCVIAGQGRAYTAIHMVRGDSGFIKFNLVNGEGIDSGTVVVDTSNGYAVVRTWLGRNLPQVKSAYFDQDAEYSWIQPHFFPKGGVELYLLRGRITRTEDREMYLDRPVYPGASGSGVFNPSMELVGIIEGRVSYDVGSAYGFFVPVRR